MSEETENINREQADGSSEIKDENSSSLESSQLVTSNQKQATENMEVHHHPQLHHQLKPWKEYLLEGLMIFFAVTLGFIAENIREHLIEKEKEKQYIQSMIKDIRQDTADFRQVVDINTFSCNLIDTLITLLTNKERSAETARMYYLARTIPFNDQGILCHNKTFEQLKSSGGLRLIHDAAVLENISSYYENIRWLETGPGNMQFENRHDLFLFTDKLFKAEVFQQMVHSSNPFIPNMPEGNPPLQSNNPDVINSVCTRYHYMYATKKVVINQTGSLINQATELIQLLQKEYRLE